MYYCQVTNELSKPGEKLNKIVIEQRERIYKERIFNEETRKMEDVIIGYGWEIVREINASDEGLRLWSTMDADERSHFVKRFLA